MKKFDEDRDLTSYNIGDPIFFNLPDDKFRYDGVVIKRFSDKTKDVIVQSISEVNHGECYPINNKFFISPREKS